MEGEENGKGEIYKEQDTCKCRDDRACGSWEDDIN